MNLVMSRMNGRSEATLTSDIKSLIINFNLSFITRATISVNNISRMATLVILDLSTPKKRMLMPEIQM